MSNTKPKGSSLGTFIALIISVALIAAAGWAILNRQLVRDTVAVMMYQPSQEILAINERVGLTDKGEFSFYSAEPEVAGADTFNEDCPRQEPDSPILGCYVNGRVFIFDITNPQLDGIEEVTAAHEMLHAVWDRTSDEKRAALRPLLLAAYEKGASPELRERFTYYERSEPDQLDNELHSIIATEIMDVGSELETYYQQFFTDRTAVVSLHLKYSTVFAGLKAQTDSLYEELAALSAQIDEDVATYEAAVAQLSADMNSFNQRANDGSFSSTAQFNAERATLLARSNAVNAQYNQINQNVQLYNQKQALYEQLGTEMEALNKSVDSIEAPQEAPAL